MKHRVKAGRGALEISIYLLAEITRNRLAIGLTTFVKFVLVYLPQMLIRKKNV